MAIGASRLGQRSWDFPGEGCSLFTKHLIEILEGRTAASRQAGKITYLDLIEGLQFAINEDLTDKPDLPRQEPIANGALASNPVLFVSARAALKGLSIDTGRVSREYHKQQLRRRALAAILFLALCSALFSAWLGAHEYAVADADGTTVFAGYPGLTGFGYPLARFRLDFRPSDFEPGSPLAKGLPLVSASGKTLGSLSLDFAPALRAYRLAAAGERDSAISLIETESRNRLNSGAARVDGSPHTGVAL